MGLPAETSLPDGTRIVLRMATRGDIESLVALLADDELGSQRDGIRDAADLAAYERAFEVIDRDRAHLLLVATAPSQSRPLPRRGPPPSCGCRDVAGPSDCWPTHLARCSAAGITRRV